MIENFCRKLEIEIKRWEIHRTLRIIWIIVKRYKHESGISKGEKRMNVAGVIFEEIIAVKFPNMIKAIMKPQIQEIL